jgi:hypothetical protein
MSRGNTEKGIEMQTLEAKSEYFTEAQATDEAMLLITRRMRRLYPEAFAAVWAKLPDGAKDAIMFAEGRADRVRDVGGKTWHPQMEEDFGEE